MDIKKHHNWTQYDNRATHVEAIKAHSITSLDDYSLAVSIQLAEEVADWHKPSASVLPLLYSEWNRRLRIRVAAETQAAEAIKNMEAVQS